MHTSVPPRHAPGATPWLRPLNHCATPRLRLLCFPPAGAGPSFYRTWATGLPRDVEALAIHLPGREGRFNEPALTDYRATVTAVHSGIRDALVPLPYALFGHSLGALLAHGVALTAAEHGGRAPEHLLLSGTGGPGSTPPVTGRDAWSDTELVEDLREMGGTAEDVLATPELLDLLLPIFRADYALCESHHADPPVGRLACPVTALGGADDRHTPDDLSRWASATTGPFTCRTFPGGHFFLTQESAGPALEAVAAALR
ncbi:thioesterase II family protein [Streptacidiphilus jiangxiensis]|uniref:Pyochelin biosynthetic protein PchC n=1 Tax=Streptacidiphilus jiangxiensis TaxID=235985 RepID=A0A1H7ULT5_STRJI|nr:thioesterase domain-containing protein [Streptacidiphilus jiangxiensis]SEL97694.1 pyochelin biosynthetic protein PchC [Streptacidiphilus jiangxiensis]